MTVFRISSPSSYIKDGILSGSVKWKNDCSTALRLLIQVQMITIHVTVSIWVCSGSVIRLLPTYSRVRPTCAVASLRWRSMTYCLWAIPSASTRRHVNPPCSPSTWCLHCRYVLISSRLRVTRLAVLLHIVVNCFSNHLHSISGTHGTRTIIQWRVSISGDGYIGGGALSKPCPPGGCRSGTRGDTLRLPDVTEREHVNHSRWCCCVSRGWAENSTVTCHVIIGSLNDCSCASISWRYCDWLYSDSRESPWLLMIQQCQLARELKSLYNRYMVTCHWL